MFYRRVLIIITLMVAAGAGLWLLREPIRIMKTRSAQIGERVAGVNVRTLTGERARLAFTEGKTLLVFFKIDCPHCHHQLDTLEKLTRKYGNQGLRTVALSRTDNPALRKTRFSFPVYIDQSQAMIGQFGRVMVPTLVLLDETGTIRYIRSGAVAFEKDEQLVDAFIREGKVITPSSVQSGADPCCERNPS